MTQSEDLRPQDTENDPGDYECVIFQAEMPDRIAAGEDLQANPHLLTCERCTALVRDLEAIAEAARIYMRTSEAEPSDSLWESIRRKIENGEAEA